MTVARGSRRRQLVPRWRPWRTTVMLDEVQGVGRTGSPPGSSVLARLRSEYRRTPDTTRAGELVAAALVHDVHDEDVVEIASLPIFADRPVLAEVAERLVAGERMRRDSVQDVQETDSRARIRTLRDVLAREPRNAVRWVDLARSYAILGQLAKAERAMEVAVRLAPDDRFVLRSAGAMYSETKDYGRALALLEATSRTTRDPWLLASSIAMAELARMRPRFNKEAMWMIRDGDFGDRDLTELAAAMGSRELSAGSDRRGRQLLRRALVEPTENTLAQVEWLTERAGHPFVDKSPREPPRAWEAEARRLAATGEWREAAANAEKWFLDQPFSIDAVVYGSFCYCEADEWECARDRIQAFPNYSDQAILLK